jgi:hypothetical protein
MKSTLLFKVTVYPLLYLAGKQSGLLTFSKIHKLHDNLRPPTIKVRRIWLLEISRQKESKTGQNTWIHPRLVI